MNLGEYIKNKRKQNKVSLITIAETLNISLGYLIAIENNEFYKIPGKAYIVAFLRSYANFLNLNSDEIIKEYKKQILISKTPNSIELPKPVEVFNLAQFQLSKKLSFVVVALVSIPLYFIIINNSNQQNNFAVTSNIPLALESEIEEIEVETALVEINKKNEVNNILQDNLDFTSLNNLKKNKEISSNQLVVLASKPKKEEFREIMNIISLKALESTWIQLRDNEGNIIFSKLMKINEVHNYQINDKFLVTTGNAGNILVTIGDKIMGKLGKKGEVLDSINISPNYFLN